MSNAPKSELEKVFADVASNYQGSDIDLHAVYAKMRKTNPVMEGNFMEQLGVPSIAGWIRIARASRCSNMTMSCR